MIQATEQRARKGSVVAIERSSSYVRAQTFETIRYSRYSLARIERSNRYGDVQVIRTNRGEVANVRVNPGWRVFTLDKPVRVNDLWRDHADTEWPDVDTMRETIRQYVVA